MSDEIVIKVDKFHLWLLGLIGAILLVVQGYDMWEIQRAAELRKRVANLEGQMQAVLESIQHGTN